MKLNWAERLVVNNPLRALEQRYLIRTLKKMAPLPPGAVALEIGCGRGAGAAIIMEEFQPSRLHIMDVDTRMIEMAGCLLAGKRSKTADLYVADAEGLPFRSGVMDAVFGFGILHHVSRWQTAVAEVQRVLKPGGLYYMEELYPHVYQNLITRYLLAHPRENRFFSNDLREVLEQEGLLPAAALELRAVGILAVARKA